MGIYILPGSSIGTSWRTVYFNTGCIDLTQDLETIQILSDDFQEYSKAIILTTALIQYTIILTGPWKQQNNTFFEHYAKFQGPLIKLTAASRYDLQLLSSFRVRERERARS